MIVVFALALSLTAGCANTGSPGAGPSGSTPSASAGPTTPATEPSLPIPTPSKTKGPEPTGEITVTGTVVAGVEAGCKVLQSPQGNYLLIAQGATAAQLQVGETVTVRGEVKPDMVTVCQQGTPLVVTSVDPG